MTQATGGSSLHGVRVDQLCEILSREISRVREESVMQAQEMRMQYEMELQALREEFYAKQRGLDNHQGELFARIEHYPEGSENPTQSSQRT